MSLIYINNDKFFQKIDDNITKLEELKISTNDIITSSISIKDVITYTFKLPISTPKEQLTNEANIQFYDNAGLDLNKQYKTFFLIKELKNEENYLIEAIAIEEHILKDKFSKIVEKTNFIDYISLSVLCFSEFYELYQQEKKRDAFVYLDNEQSFIAIYRDGEYLYSKTLNPLSPLLKTIDMDYSQFVELMIEKGVNKENYDLDDFLIANEIDKFFSEYFMSINNRLSYGKNIFYLDNIDNIYFYTPFTIKDIDTLKEFWELTGINFTVLPNEEINLLDKLAIYYNEKHYQDEINFSIFPRPPKFYKTKTFQLIMLILATFAIFGGDFGYRYYNTMQLENKINTLKHQVAQKSKKLAKLESINKIIIQKLNLYNSEINSITSQINLIKQILQKAIELKTLPKTNEDFITISKLLKQNRLKTFIISKDINNTFNIGVYTTIQNRKYIANFMDNLSNKGYQNIQTDKIDTLDINYYVSLIRFQK